MSRDQNKIPRLVGQEDRAGTPMTRGRILDATVKAAYGPGQRPNSMPGEHYRDFSFTPSFDYEPPGDWPPAGFLLRMPQVVWLSTFFPYKSSHASPSWPALEYGATVDSVFGSTPPYHYAGGFPMASAYAHSTAGEPTAAENDRLRAAFLEAKARIEAVRPGRTYVEILDWLTDDLRDRYQVAANWFHLTAPPASFGFAGTDFLHIYCGHFGSDTDGGFGSIFRFNFPTFTDLAGNTAHARSVARVRGSYAKFAGFAVDIFTYEGAAARGWSTPLPDYTFSFTGLEGSCLFMTVPDAVALLEAVAEASLPLDSNYNVNYISMVGAAILEYGPGATFGATIRDYIIPPDWPRPGGVAGNAEVSLPLIESLSAYQTAQREGVVTQDNALPAYRAAGASAAFAESIGLLDDDGNDYGVSVAGDTLDLTADSIVARVAAHYGFDPATGADLG